MRSMGVLNGLHNTWCNLLGLHPSISACWESSSPCPPVQLIILVWLQTRKAVMDCSCQCSSTCGLEDVLTGIHVTLQAGTHVCMCVCTQTQAHFLFYSKTFAQIYISWSFYLILNRTETLLKLSFLLSIPRCFLLQKFLSLPLSLLA